MVGDDKLCGSHGRRQAVHLQGYPFDYDPSPEKLRAQNDQCSGNQSLARHAFGFVYSKPQAICSQPGEFLNRCVRDGPMGA